MQIFTRYEEIEPYITKDSSIIRELMHPSVHGNSNQSLAEATVPAGGKTLLHKHHLTEEIYHITEGSGIMILGSEEFEVKKRRYCLHFTRYSAQNSKHRKYAAENSLLLCAELFS
ncbi:cupin domain-containing protein [Methanosarcina barkeri]|uniref:hypothetical protein n=1 Tax=Methanosarcina barkeri TaxID=2208 RepID=UPI000ACB1115|nr:hypothetical protein [Methanosarcina barkeri]